MTDDQLAATPGLEGMNASFVADVLSDMLMHTRCGFHLHRSVEGRSNNPMLQGKYRDLGNGGARRIAALERLVAGLGGDPQYVSPSARATQKADTALVQSTFLLDGSLDAMTSELVMLDAVLLAAARDDANWSGLAGLVESFPEGSAQASVRRVCDEAAVEVAGTLTWVRETRTRLIGLQASSSAMAAAGAKAEEAVARIRNLFA
jgi:hypothetical protein